MKNPLRTIFQGLDKTINGGWKSPAVHTYDMSAADPGEIVYKTDDILDLERKKLELRQQKYLTSAWKKANAELSTQSIAGLTNIKLMYRDCDLMDSFPEIGAALDIASEEACCLSDENRVLNVSSPSERVKNVLEDLFYNRLDSQVTLPMIARATCKYGNDFMLLNINERLGITGWRQLPVYDVERHEYGLNNPYAYASPGFGGVDIDNQDTQFVWVGQNDAAPFRNWQVAHFRLLSDSIFLPYGVSWLNKARRHWRMLSLMEDMMLIYRLERSIERRVFKIYVGNIAAEDVPAYVQEIANNFKRSPLVDPMTGQLDLRKNIMAVDQDYFIPVRSENAPNPIETLSAAQNLTAMDDIKYVQDKLLAGLQIPKTFLNFDKEVGDGKNLALMDIRFTRAVHRIQQALIMELNKVAMIHLYLLGFTDDISNFTITMNNPSSQAEMLSLENLQKRITVVKDATGLTEGGLPLLSVRRAMKQILHMSDSEIQDSLNELRLEAALSVELQKTSQIIKRTGQFDDVDNIYGEPGAEYTEGAPEEGGGGPGGAGGAGPIGGGPIGGGSPLGEPVGEFGDDIDTAGDIDTPDEGEIQGNEGEEPLGGPGAPEEPSNESLLDRLLSKKLLQEAANGARNRMTDRKRRYQESLARRAEKDKGGRTPLVDDSFLVNEEIDNLAKELDDFLAEHKEQDILKG